jgi:hypothetical protein
MDLIRQDLLPEVTMFRKQNFALSLEKSGCEGGAGLSTVVQTALAGCGEGFRQSCSTETNYPNSSPSLRSVGSQ